MTAARRIELAHEPGFKIGNVTVSPAHRELVSEGGRREIVEHRVMQVLVALAKAKGAIVTRDELVDWCWEGRIVGDDAINRVISRLRKTAAGIGGGLFRIETLSKVGYRLVVNGDEPLPERPQTAIAASSSGGARASRRALLVGVTAAGALAVAGGAWLYRSSRRPEMPSEVAALLAQADQARNHGGKDGQSQAIGLARRAVALAPDNADAWGLLGFFYAVPSHSRPRAEGEALRARAEAAGRRALALDPGNGYGELALAVALPFIGHWAERQRRLRRGLADRPGDAFLLASLGVNLMFVGRNKEAASAFAQIRRRPLMPAVYNNYLHALWSAGPIEALDQAMNEGASLYPSQPAIWITRNKILMLSGQAGAATAMTLDAETVPNTYDEDFLTDLRTKARAIRSASRQAVLAALDVNMRHAKESAFLASTAIEFASAIGEIDQAYAIADAYYFGRGFIIPDARGPLNEPIFFAPNMRNTRFLFFPSTTRMRSDPRFAQLVETIGLERYWRQSGVQPDYRRRLS